jgi:ABC-type uncharacterized transport system involved in gliding motility auxiliary subunit
VDVLIVGGPTSSIPDETANAIRQFLIGGGKAMVLVNSVVIDQSRLIANRNRNSFGYLPEEFGVIVEDDLVFDLQSNETLSFNTGVGNVFLPYPFWMRVPVIDRKVAGNVGSVLLPWASSVGIAESERGRIEVVPLLETTEFAAIDFNYGDVRPNSPVFEEVTRSNFVQALMGAAIVQSDAPVGQDAYRLVVFGDSEWLTDGVPPRAQENVALGLNLVDWLAQEDTLAEVRSKVVSSRDLLFTSSTHKNVSQWANVAGVPLLIVVVGLLRSLRRRRFGFTMYGQARASGFGFRRRRRDESTQEDDE